MNPIASIKPLQVPNSIRQSRKRARITLVSNEPCVRGNGMTAPDMYCGRIRSLTFQIPSLMFLPFVSVRDWSALTQVSKRWNVISTNRYCFAIQDQMKAICGQTVRAVRGYLAGMSESESKENGLDEDSQRNPVKLKKIKEFQKELKKLENRCNKTIKSNSAMYNKSSGRLEFNSVNNCFNNTNRYYDIFADSMAESTFDIINGIAVPTLNIPYETLNIPFKLMNPMLVGKIIEMFNNMEAFNFSGCNFSKVGFECFCEVLTKSFLHEDDLILEWINSAQPINFSEISIEGKPLSQEQFKMLFTSLTALFNAAESGVNELNLSNNSICDLDIILEFCERFKVKNLVLDSNPIDLPNIKKLASHIKNAEDYLVAFSIHSGGGKRTLTDEGFEAILDAGLNLKDNNVLDSLYLPLTTTRRQAACVEQLGKTSIQIVLDFY